MIAAKCPVHRTLDGEVMFASGSSSSRPRPPRRAVYHRYQRDLPATLDARRAQLRDRALLSPGSTSTGARGAAVHDHVEPGALGVERGLLDAVVEREPDDVDRIDAVVAQQPLESVCAKPE